VKIAIIDESLKKS